MIAAAMLRTVAECGEGVLVIVDGLTDDDLRRSRLTRGEVQRLVLLIGHTLAALPDAARTAMPEIDFAGWQASVRTIESQSAERDDTLWFAVRSLVPATLSWLRVYRREQPALFAFVA
jgi:uncharacterized protein with HEPN domain